MPTQPCLGPASASPLSDSSNASREKDLWARVHSARADALAGVGKKRKLLERTHDARESEMNAFNDEVYSTFLNAAIAEKERSSVPRSGRSTDRRAIQCVREVFREDNTHVLMCFVCTCKHVAHLGFDKFGKPQQKCTICYRQGTSNQKNILK